jgi:hypothetical protein
MTSRKTSSRKLGFQQLENRQMMSGTPIGHVTATLKNGTLTITGDNNNDGIEITQSPNHPNRLTITGLQQPNSTKVNGTTGPVVFNGVTGDVNINLGSGNDNVAIEGTGLGVMTYLPRNLTVNLGNGNNVLEMVSVTVGGKVSVTGGTGDDTVILAMTNVGSPAVNGGANDLTINLGGGNNQMALYYVSVERDLQILDTASNSDELLMYGDYAGRNLLIETGAGNDILELAEIDAGSLLDIYTGAGQDQLTLGTVTGGLFSNDPMNGSVNAGEQIWVDLGAGDDTLNFTAPVNANSAVYLGNTGQDHSYTNGLSLSGSFSGFENYFVNR